MDPATPYTTRALLRDLRDDSMLMFCVLSVMLRALGELGYLGAFWGRSLPDVLLGISLGMLLMGAGLTSPVQTPERPETPGASTGETNA